MLTDRCGCVVLWLLSLRRPFGCTFLSRALWCAGLRWCRNARSPWGVGPEAVGAVGLCDAPTPDGARQRTFVASAAAVARDRGGGLVMVAVLRLEVEELWCWAPPAIILATVTLLYVPGRGGGTCGCWARRANGMRLRGRVIPLHVR